MQLFNISHVEQERERDTHRRIKRRVSLVNRGSRLASLSLSSLSLSLCLFSSSFSFAYLHRSQNWSILFILFCFLINSALFSQAWVQCRLPPMQTNVIERYPKWSRQIIPKPGERIAFGLPWEASHFERLLLVLIILIHIPPPRRVVQRYTIVRAHHRIQSPRSIPRATPIRTSVISITGNYRHWQVSWNPKSPNCIENSSFFRTMVD